METKHKIIKYAGIVVAATIFCRILGLGREIVISNRFGAGIETDAFFIAFMIPNLLRIFLGEGALRTAFIPIFTDYLTNHNKKKANYFANNVLNILVVLLIIIIFLGIWGAPLLINIIAIGFKSNPFKYELAVNLTRTMFPYIGFVAIAVLFMGILNSCDHFLIPALSPAMLNVSIILFAFLLSFKYGIYSLAIGVIIGGFGQLLIQIPMLVKKKIKYQFIVNFKDPGVRKFLKLLLPAMLGLTITQINVVVDRMIASNLIDGSISALYYANRLMQFPLGAFGIAISTAIFPTLSKYAAYNNISEMKKTLLFGLKILLLITIPSAIGLIVLKNSIVRLIYEHGAFTKTDSIMTANALLYYSIGLFAYAFVKLVTMAFYALKDAKSPVTIGAYIVIINLILDLILVKYLAHSGLALATSIAAILNMIFLIKIIQSKIGYFQIKAQLKFIFKIILSSVFLGISCFLVNNYMGNIFDLSYKINQVIQVIISILSGSVVYFISCYVLGVKEIRNLKQNVKIILKGND
ncbi:MAG: murein biosynthesis integral membrane protein MurJ [Candidatus Caldatribacteriota bacterium]|nr:murein biosynthesis integral membrane protein MurJ [Candidatus Caldatribacteriota bacterium]